MSTVRICDRCGKPLEGIGNIRAKRLRCKSEDEYGFISCSYDICCSCYKDFEKFIKDYSKEV